MTDKGNEIIVGVDEAGRGALAGPLAVGFVIYDKSFFTGQCCDEILSINDSKKMTRLKREKSLEIINKYSLINKTVFVSPGVIDELNINRATEFALIKFLKNTKIKPDVIIMDGNFKFKLDVKFIPVIKGDYEIIYGTNPPGRKMRTGGLYPDLYLYVRKKAKSQDEVLSLSKGEGQAGASKGRGTL